MSNERIDLTQFEGISEGSWEVRPRSRYKIATEEHYVAQVMNNRGGDLEPFAEANANAIAKLPNLIAELKRCYRIIDILQDSEDFDTQVAFHEEGLCKYLKYPCGPCESSEEE